MRSTFINWLGARAIAFICLASSPYFLSLSLSHTLSGSLLHLAVGQRKCAEADWKFFAVIWLACCCCLLPVLFTVNLSKWLSWHNFAIRFLVYLNFNEIVAKWHTHERRVSLFGDAPVRVKLNFNSGSNLLTKLSPIEVEIDESCVCVWEIFDILIS